MFKIIDTVPCSELSDLARFQDLIQKAIDGGEVQEYAKFRKVSERELKKKEKAALAEAKEAEQALKEIKKKSGSKGASSKAETSEDELRAMIMDKNKSRMDALVNNLEKKYAGKKDAKSSPKGKKKRKTESEAPLPSEEEFLALQSKVDKGRASTRKSRRVSSYFLC